MIHKRPYIESAQRFAEELVPRLSSAQKEALDLFDEVLKRKEFVLTFDMEPGDILFASNHSLVHGRTAFRDSILPTSGSSAGVVPTGHQYGGGGAGATNRPPQESRASTLPGQDLHGGGAVGGDSTSTDPTSSSDDYDFSTSSSSEPVQKKRHFLRLWLTLPKARELPPHYQDTREFLYTTQRIEALQGGEIRRTKGPEPPFPVTASWEGILSETRERMVDSDSTEIPNSSSPTTTS